LSSNIQEKSESYMPLVGTFLLGERVVDLRFSKYKNNQKLPEFCVFIAVYCLIFQWFSDLAALPLL